ncbi:hypothetical protein ACYSNO_09220 [Enterococcus sp. LJL98]
MTSSIYIHLDTTSNTVLTQGITAGDFQRGIVHQPKNILLLNPSTDLGEFESHTSMKMIRGQAAIDQFFQTLAQNRVVLENKWIDFTDLAMLKELTPLEISELLYFGHMKTHLYSAFFYKLQNNFVYFDLDGGLNRTYYRYLDEFYRILAVKLTQLTLEKLNERRTFFRKPQLVNDINSELLKALKEAMKEGLFFSFEKAVLINQEFRIPLFLVEEVPPFTSKVLTRIKEQQLGYLIYHQDLKTWTLDAEDEFLGISTKTDTSF